MQPGQQKISQFDPITSMQSGDIIPVVRNGQNKRITVDNFSGIVPDGFQAAAQIWTFSSWDAASRTGIITVPSDATTKYQVGNRVRITQTTGGNKYAIIHNVTTTTLALFFPVGTTLINEAISNPVYSALDSPFGFNKDPELWTIYYTKTNRTQTNATVNVWYNIWGSITVGVGKWLLSYTNPAIATSSGTGYLSLISALGTATNGSPVPGTRTYSAASQPTSSQQNDQMTVTNIPYAVASTTTLYGISTSPSGGTLTLYSEATSGTNAGDMFIKALSAYL